MSRADSRCEYCRSDERLCGVPFEIDHVIPLSADGQTVPENLALACPSCNRRKGGRTQALDPITGGISPLFNPRQGVWAEHFVWSEDGLSILGLTEIGRATVSALAMNHPLVISARRIWSSAGYHPPAD
ncbi:MAG: HNH endonuclease [Chloroflexi bacterium]|nr:HNH endonuclease [Chloroflexota bacterium]